MLSIWIISAIFWAVFSFVILCCVFYTSFKRKVRISEYVGEATLLLVLATLIIGSLQLSENEKANKARFLLDLKNTFYSSNATNRLLIDSADDNRLVIVAEKSWPGDIRPKDTYTESEVDEYIVNFDYINIFLQKGVLDLKEVDRIFGWYVRQAWVSQAIQDYLKKIRKIEPSVYQEFEKLASKLQHPL